MIQASRAYLEIDCLDPLRLASGYLAPVVVAASVVALLGFVGCSASSSSSRRYGLGGFTGSGAGGTGIVTDGGAQRGSGRIQVQAARRARPARARAEPAGTGGATGTGCYVTVTAVAPATTMNVEAGKGARMRVEGHVWGTFHAADHLGMDGDGVGHELCRIRSRSLPTALDSTGAIVDFPLEDVGRYRVAAVAQSAGHPDCQTPSPLVISTVPPGPMAYVVRVTASGFPVQDMRITLDPTDPQPIAFPLQLGVAANLLPQGADTGSSLASYIRISDPASG